MDPLNRLPLSYVPHNRHLTVSTRIYRAMRDTMRLFKSHIVLPPTYTDFNVFTDTSGVQELNLSFLNQKLSVSPLKPTPEPISGGESHCPVIATITELCGLRFALSMTGDLPPVTGNALVYSAPTLFNTLVDSNHCAGLMSISVYLFRHRT